jgi:hypothetical protein
MTEPTPDEVTPDPEAVDDVDEVQTMTPRANCAPRTRI